MGVGIGGDYPLSAIISSEFAASRSRGRLMTAVFAAQGWGNLGRSIFSLEIDDIQWIQNKASAIVAVIVVQAYKTEILASPFPAVVPVDYMWRLLIGLGCVPGVVALYFRLTIPETPRFTMDIERNIAQATSDIENVLTTGNYVVDEDAPVVRVKAPRASFADFSAYFGRWENMKVLIGTAYSWFALDVSPISVLRPAKMNFCIQIAFYGLSLNSSIILTAIKFGSPTGSTTTSLYVYENLYNVSVGNIILALAGLIPGYWVSFIFIDSWGRKPIQLMGFITLTIIFAIMGSCIRSTSFYVWGSHFIDRFRLQ